MCELVLPVNQEGIEEDQSTEAGNANNLDIQADQAVDTSDNCHNANHHTESDDVVNLSTPSAVEDKVSNTVHLNLPVQLQPNEILQ